MAKNLIIDRMAVQKTKAEQKEFEKKVSIDNLNEILEESELKIIPKYSIQYAVYFGSDADLNLFGKELAKEKIAYEIK